MNFKSKGLLISIIILIILILLCHISNYLYNKNKFYNIQLSIPKNTPPLQYNKIDIDNQNGLSNCLLSNEAQIPCKIISNCNTNPSTTKYNMTESEMIDLYKYVYETAGLQVLQRTLNETPITTKSYNSRPSWWY